MNHFPSIQEIRDDLRNVDRGTPPVAHCSSTEPPIRAHKTIMPRALADRSPVTLFNPRAAQSPALSQHDSPRPCSHSEKKKARCSSLVSLAYRLISLLHQIIGALDTLFGTIEHPFVRISNLTADGFRLFLRWFILATCSQENHCGQGNNFYIHRFPHGAGEVVTD